MEPKCFKCWDKGYSTVFDPALPSPRRKFCNCAKGRRLKLKESKLNK
jgi:hypothetical protein